MDGFSTGLVTCEVKDLMPGRGVRGFFTDVKGHILADVVIRAAENRLWLELPAPLIAPIAAHIEKYIVVDRVEVHPGRGSSGPELGGGPGSAATLAPLWSGPSDPTIPWSHSEIALQEQQALVSIDGHFGVPALKLWSSSSAAAEIRQVLLATAGLLEVDDDAIEVLRVEEGVPRFGIDFGPENLPQETGLDDAVSYTKGCYLGQEVVARPALPRAGGSTPRPFAVFRGPATDDRHPSVLGRARGRVRLPAPWNPPSAMESRCWPCCSDAPQKWAWSCSSRVVGYCEWSRSDREGGTTTAGTDGLRVIELEPGAHDSLDVVDLGSIQIPGAHLVDEHLEAFELQDGVVVSRLLVEIEGVFETATTAAADRHAQAVGLVHPLLLAGDLDHFRQRCRSERSGK